VPWSRQEFFPNRLSMDKYTFLKFCHPWLFVTEQQDDVNENLPNHYFLYFSKQEGFTKQNWLIFLSYDLKNGLWIFNTLSGSYKTLFFKCSV